MAIDLIGKREYGRDSSLQGGIMPNDTENIRPKTSQINQLKKIVEEEKGHVWSIIVATVDPDGIGTAMILKEIIVHLGGEAEIYFGGAFSHPQNETLWNLFELEKHLLELKDLPDKGPIALADSCKLQDSRFHKEIESDRFRIIVDHHRDKPLDDADRFVYIASCGAAATLAHAIVATLNVIEVDDLQKKSQAIPHITLSKEAATLAAIGILSDTERLTAPSVTQADRKAYSALMAMGSQEKVSESFNYELPPRFYEMLSQCLKASTVVGSYIITRPNTLLSMNEGDFLGIIADEFRKREGIKTVVVWGITEGRLRASIRTKSKELNLNTFISDLFGAKYSGGKHDSGGANIPLDEHFHPSKETVSLLIAFLDASFREKLEKRVGKKARLEEDDLD